jgi:pyrroline-5-carboxylate reductase
LIKFLGGLLKMDIGFIGAGNIGSSIIKGIYTSEKFQNLNIHVFDIDKKKAENLGDYNIILEKSLEDLVNNSNVVVIALKPNIIENCLNKIKDLVNKKLIITVAVGIPIKFYTKMLGSDKKIVRVMPNTPALVGEGMSVLTLNENIENDEKELTKKIFSCIGAVEVLDENLLSKVTSLTGSSPAYIFILIEAMADGAVLDGIPRDLAYKMAAQTILGSAKMVLDTKLHPGILKDQVCSPAGTTISAVRKLEESGFRSNIIEAMKECNDKALEIGKKFE